MVDAHLFIHRRIANDQLRGLVRSTPMHPNDIEWIDSKVKSDLLQTLTTDSEIDFDWYARQWEGAQTVMGLFSWLQTLVEVKKEKAKPVTKTNDFEFGGDYAP